MAGDHSQLNANKVVLITGGTKGIGAGISKAYLEQGYQVVICARQEPETVITVAGKNAEFIAADLKDYASIDALFEQIQSRYGRLDILINNAGGSPAVEAATVSPRFHESIFKLNLIAPLYLAQKANAMMQAQASEQSLGGCILFIGSISAMRASPGTAAYGAAKAGVLSLVQSLAVEWAPKVRVAAVSPGLIQTEQSHLHYGDEKGLQAVANTIPLQRLGTPNDVAKACLYLSSEDASYVSGSNLLLHGGGEAPSFLAAADAQ